MLVLISSNMHRGFHMYSSNLEVSRSNLQLLPQYSSATIGGKILSLGRLCLGKAIKHHGVQRRTGRPLVGPGPRETLTREATESSRLPPLAGDASE